MEICKSVAQLRARLAPESSIGFVPTMGNLHAGHMDLVRIARERSTCVVLSIFVNRLQFGPAEDFDRYPRTFDDDCAKCLAAGVDVIFAPDESVMYPEPQDYVIDLPAIQNMLEGAVRPGHFRGVATVVMKLFNMVRPGLAVFGRKDYQQCRVIANMVRQFEMPVELVFAETVRAEDGLALSSRNRFLSTDQRAEAPQLHSQISLVAQELRRDPRSYPQLEQDAVSRLARRGWQPDYVAIRRQSDLLAPQATDRQLVVLAAARIGSTRLIDNLEVSLPA
jgi:pantoate--beta-alanine ligase